MKIHAPCSSQYTSMASSYPGSSGILQTPLHFPFLNKLVFFHKPYRSNLLRIQQQSRSVVCTTPLTTIHEIDQSRSDSEYKIDLAEQFTDEDTKLEIDDRNSRLQVQNFVDRIRALPISKRIEMLNSFEKDCGNSTLFRFNEMLMALVIADEPVLALKLYSNMSSHGLSPDSCTLSVMIRCHCKKNDVIEAKQIFGFMVEMGFRPDDATLTVLINSLCRKGKLQKAFAVIDGIGCKPTIQMYNCLIKGLCYVGKVEEAYEMLMKIKGDCVKPDIYTYTGLMDGFCKVGRTDEAMELLNEAMEIGLKPNVVTFNTLFNGYCKEGRPLEGIGVLKQMKERNCAPDYISYSTLLNGLLKWNEAKTGLWIYKEMVGVGFDVDDRMMNSLLRGLCREEILFEDACELFDKMKIGNHVVYESTFGPVIKALCVGGKVDEALSVLVLMYEANGVPSRSIYDILIDEFRRKGALLVACNIYGAALKQGLFPLHKPLF